MAQVEIFMPKMGESVMEATITRMGKERRRYRGTGRDDRGNRHGQGRLRSTSTAEGVLVKLYNEGDVVKIGEPFAIIETNASAASAPKRPLRPKSRRARRSGYGRSEQIYRGTAEAEPVASKDGRFYSPLVKSIAQKEGISQNRTGRHRRYRQRRPRDQRRYHELLALGP